MPTKEVSARRRVLGLCVRCGVRPARPRRTLCERCATDAREYNQAHRDKIVQYLRAYRRAKQAQVNQRAREKYGRNAGEDRAYSRAYRAAHKSRARAAIVAQLNAQRLTALSIVGGEFGISCRNCGFRDLRALQFDHIRGGGSKHLKSIKGSNALVRLVLLDPAWGLKELRVLCANCNVERRWREGQGFRMLATTPSVLAARRLFDKVQLLVGGDNPRCGRCGIEGWKSSRPEGVRLTLQHLRGGGMRDRALSGGNTGLYRRLSKLEPSSLRGEYDLFCPNCQAIDAFERKVLSRSFGVADLADARPVVDPGRIVFRRQLRAERLASEKSQRS